MKKLGSNHDKETPQEELKHLRKENKKLASQKNKFKLLLLVTGNTACFLVTQIGNITFRIVPNKFE